MRQYSIDHDSKAFEAFKRHYNIEENAANVLKKMTFLAGAHIEQIGSCQAWIITDNRGDKWLQSYHTIVSVKWRNSGDVEHLGKWSMTTSHHQTRFTRMA